jgi:Fe-S cluster assembly iron-binding protein IscA
MSLLKVTEAAKITLKLVRDTLVEERRESGNSDESLKDVPEKQLGLRLGLSRSQNIAFKLGIQDESDQVVQYEGQDILFVDQEMGKLLDGATLDCVDTKDGPRLMICR